jgi:cytochrome c peroxidase
MLVQYSWCLVPRCALLAVLVLGASCTNGQEAPDEDPNAPIDGLDPETLRAQANTLFGPLPSVTTTTKYTLSDAKIALGRQLFYEVRLSKNQDLSCNSCHALTDFGIDRRSGSGKTSLGHRGQLGTRNAPTVYNAARQIAQFWDGRAANVEEQAKGPILNPVEMAMTDQASVVSLLNSIPGYAPLFQSAFPGVAKPITYENMALAIGAFERKLVTKDRFDRYLDGEDTLSHAEAHGLILFIQTGCPDCHGGPGIGGLEYQKLGVIKTYMPSDVGRFAVTNKATDRYVFKVPSLRNIEKTAPYFHDGSLATLTATIKFMVEYQTTTGTLPEADIEAIAAFLKTLTGETPASYITEPAKLPGSASTPPPDSR